MDKTLPHNFHRKGNLSQAVALTVLHLRLQRACLQLEICVTATTSFAAEKSVFVTTNVSFAAEKLCLSAQT